MSECSSVDSLQRLVYALAERVAAQSELLSKRAEKMGIGYDLQDMATHTNANGGKQSDIPFRCDLLPAAEILDIAHILKQGADKYGDNNWKSITTDEHINHALTHALAWLAGDASEDHLSHMVTRGLFAMYTAKAEAASGIDPVVVAASNDGPTGASGPIGTSGFQLTDVDEVESPRMRTEIAAIIGDWIDLHRDDEGADVSNHELTKQIVEELATTGRIHWTHPEENNELRKAIKDNIVEYHNSDMTRSGLAETILETINDSIAVDTR